MIDGLAAILIVHVASSVVLAYGLWQSVERGRVYAALFAGLLGYQILGLLDVPALIEQFGFRVIATGELVALFGCALVVGGVELLARLDRQLAGRRLGSVVDDVVAAPGRYFVIVALAFSIVFAITSVRGFSVFEVNWEDARAEAGVRESAATLLLFLALPGAWLLWRSKHYGLAGIGFAVAIGLTAVYGSRAALITLPAVIALDLQGRRVFSRGAGTLVKVGAGILGLVALVHVTGRLVRGFGLGGLLALARGESLSGDEIWELLASIDWTGGESGIFEYFFFVVSEPSIPGVAPLATVLRWVLMYFPRSLVESFKPQDPTYLLWTHAANTGLFDGAGFIDQVLALVRVGDSGSVHPTFWGEAWMNGRWLGLVVMCGALAVSIHLLERLYVSLSPTAAALCLPAAIVGYLMVARGNSTIGFGYIAYLLPLAVVANYVVVMATRALRGSTLAAPGGKQQ